MIVLICRCPAGVFLAANLLARGPRATSSLIAFSSASVEVSRRLQFDARKSRHLCRSRGSPVRPYPAAARLLGKPAHFSPAVLPVNALRLKGPAQQNVPVLQVGRAGQSGALSVNHLAREGLGSQLRNIRRFARKSIQKGSKLLLACHSQCSGDAVGNVIPPFHVHSLGPP
jgi:hypothetical protein